jgi:hypothetical protein
MTPLFKKLNWKNGMPILALNNPASFITELNAIAAFTTISNKPTKAINFCIAFVTEQKEIEKYFNAIAAKLADDAVLWFCYPKQTSKKYSCNFNRDNGWQALGNAGFEPVRAVAIDEDWSALRFRKV